MFFGNNLHAMLASVSTRASELGDANIANHLRPFIDYMNEAGFPAHEAVRSVGLQWEALNSIQENVIGINRKPSDDLSVARTNAIRVLYFNRMVFAEPLAYLSGDGTDVESTSIMCKFLSSNQQMPVPFNLVQIGDRDTARRLLAEKNSAPQNQVPENHS